MANANDEIVDDAIRTVESYNQLCMALMGLIHSRDALNVDCPVISQVIPEIYGSDSSQSALRVSYYPNRGSRMERCTRVTRKELLQCLLV